MAYYDYATPETMETEKDEIFRDEKVSDEIISMILKTFYKQVGIGFVSAELERDLKTFVKKQYSSLHCFNVRTKHLNDSGSKISKILSKHEVVPNYGFFSIVGNYENVLLSEHEGGPLRTIFSKPLKRQPLYPRRSRKVPVGWNTY